ncbi:MAG: hypothetical protein HYT62_04405 [Candidatus Yanofskybacteria bacterium]|nr:hypothetical protein [Candidatus Yanofskybacteria bacterium]
MIDFFKRHLHPLGGKIIFWNFLALITIKLLLSPSVFRLASLIDTIPVFDSREIISLTNQSRIAENLLPLQANVKLDLAAEAKLNDMATKEYFAHVSPDGTNPWFWMKTAQYQYSSAGENLALGFFNARDTIRAWLNSPSHRANILNNKYREIGVAVKAVEINGQDGILVVQMFGSSVTKTAKTGQLVKIQATPVVTPLSLATPLPDNIVLGQARDELVTIQYVSTDLEINPVTEPISVKSGDVQNIEKLSVILDNVFSMYFLAIMVISAAVFSLFERNRNMALKMSLNAALFILSIIVPISGLPLDGLIF